MGKEQKIYHINYKLPTSVTSIGKDAFAYNAFSGELDLSNTNLTTIGIYAFSGSSDGSTNQIASVKLPNTVTSIGYAAFRYNILESVTFYGKSSLTGISIGSYAWGWASGYNATKNIYFVNE